MIIAMEDMTNSHSQRHYLEQELAELLRRPGSLDLLDQNFLDGLWYWDLENPDHEYMSPTFWKTLGFDPSEKQHLAKEWVDLMFSDDCELARAEAQKHLANSEYPFDQVVRYRRKDGSPVTIRCRGKCFLKNGKPIRMLGSHVVVSDHKETMIGSTVARMMDMTHDAILSWTEETGIETWNKGAEEMFRLRKVDALGKVPFRSARITSGADWEKIKAVVAEGDDWGGEITHTLFDGSQVPTTARVSGVKLNDGRFLYLAICRDDTDRQEHSRQRELLLHELKHRVKNLFAVVQAMIGIASRSAPDVPTLADDLRSRLVSLAAAHTASFHVDAEAPIWLETMVREILSPYDGSASNIEISGEPVRLNSSNITPIGLILHEFATNAVKHGALKTPEGKVRITWRVTKDTGDEKTIRLKWLENGSTIAGAGTPVAADGPEGFGTILMDNSARQLNGTLEQSFDGTVFCNTLTFTVNLSDI